MLGGAGMLAYASDHPHEHGAGIQPLLARLSDENRDAVLRGNASELYGLSAPQVA